MARLGKLRDQTSHDHDRLKRWVADRTGYALYRSQDKMMAGLRFFGDSDMSYVALAKENGLLFGVPKAVITNHEKRKVVLLPHVAGGPGPKQWLESQGLNVGRWRWIVKTDTEVSSKIGPSDDEWTEMYKTSLRLGFINKDDLILGENGEDMRGQAPPLTQVESACREIAEAITIESVMASGSTRKNADLCACVIRLYDSFPILVHESHRDSLSQEASKYLAKAYESAADGKIGACAASLSFFLSAIRELSETKPKAARSVLGSDVANFLLME